jgi:hypothetical protein
MRDPRCRLEKLEACSLRRSLAATAAEFACSVDDLLDEAHDFFALPLAAQLAEVDTLAEHFTAAELAGIKTTLIREYQPPT